MTTTEAIDRIAKTARYVGTLLMSFGINTGGTFGGAFLCGTVLRQLVANPSDFSVAAAVFGLGLVISGLSIVMARVLVRLEPQLPISRRLVVSLGWAALGAGGLAGILLSDDAASIAIGIALVSFFVTLFFGAQLLWLGRIRMWMQVRRARRREILAIIRERMRKGRETSDPRQ